MSGKAHLPYLVVSLYTLRKHWSGPVCVYAWTDSFEHVARIAMDPRLNIGAYRRDPEYRGKNAQFIDKQSLMRSFPAEDVSLYLDADTMIAAPLDYLFAAASQVGFCATQFNDWTTNGGMIHRRVDRLRGRLEADTDEIIDSLQDWVWPSVNGGVFACKSLSPVLPIWIDWTWRVRDIFIADETTLHAVMLRVGNRRFEVALGGDYNCSPKYQPKDLPDDDVAIWHFHGDSNVRPNKSRKGLRLWWPVYQECLRGNIGYINEWKGEVNNKWINKLETEEQQHA